MFKKEWNERDELVLIDRFPNEGASDALCTVLQRSKASIRQKADKLGIANERKEWTEEEINILKKEYSVHGPDTYLCKKLKKGKYAVVWKANKLGLKRIYWTEEQDNILKEFYLNEGASIRLGGLLKKSKSAIYSRAKALGLTKLNGNIRKWTEKEIEYLKINYWKDGATKYLEKELGRNKEAIRSKARDLGLKPSPRKLLRGYGDINGAWLASVKRNAATRGILFSLDAEYLWNLYLTQNKRCKLSGLDILLVNKRYSKDQTASIDRIDSKKGYETGNIQWVHRDINMMKLNKNQEEFIQICMKIANFQNKNNKI